MAISQKLEKRTISFGLIIIAIFFLLVCRLAYLQLIQGDKYFQRAESNRIEYQTIGAPRGKIFTTNAEILVTNKMAYSASIRDKTLGSEENVKLVVDGLSQLINLDRLELLESLTRSVKDGNVTLIDDLTAEIKETLVINKEDLPGTTIERIVDDKGNLLKEYLRVNLKKVSTQNLLKTCKKLTELFSLKYDELLIKIIAKGLKERGNIRVKRNLTQEEMVILEENLQDLPGVVVEKESIRDYVHGPVLAHTLGYMGAINIDELQLFKDQGYRGDDYIGKFGLERYYESYLRGIDGREQIEVNSLNQKIRTLGVNEPLPGANLYINIDLGLQKKAEELLANTLTQLRDQAKNNSDLKGGPTGGAIIVMDPRNGKLLTFVSNPAFDPNLFAAGISSKDLKQLQNDPLKPFTNRVIGIAPPPGSIFKIVSAAAYLGEGFVDENTIVTDVNGTYSIGEWTYSNWAKDSRGGYGDLNIVDAIAHSNNIFFYSIAHDIYKAGRGGEVLPDYAKKFGLGKITGIDLTGEEPGFVPDLEYKKKLGEIWVPGNSVHLSIGQWDLKTTPLQLIRYICAIGNGGKLYRPYLVDRIESYDGMLIKKFEPEVTGELPISKEHLKLIKQGMVGVSTYGTAVKAFEDLPIEVAGKTGTAQTASSFANHGWFAGFAPANNPQIAILVFIEHGVTSSNTLPIVRDILKYYFKIQDSVSEDSTPMVQESLTEEVTNFPVEEEVQQSESDLSEKYKEFFNQTSSSP